MFRILLFTLLALAVSLTASGQAVLSGHVADSADGEPLPGVVVRAYADGKIKAFASVKSDGAYTLKIPALAADSLTLTVQCIGYEKQSRRVANRAAAKVDFSMSVSSTTLREVQVSVPRINQLGDTLIYNLASYLGKSDLTLEDGLKKLPGVEVEGSGKIKYQGKGISNFYIEGMDMLGGRYSQATRNLPASYVTDVEVLNNHQEAKIDKGTQSDAVAINVKLKSQVKFKPVGTSEALVGYGGKWLYRVGATGMMFTPKFQTMLSAKAGNFNLFALGDLREHVVIRRFSESREGLASDALGSIGGSSPPLKSSRYISPMDRSVSLNFMNKVGDDRSVKVNASYAYSATDYSYSQTSTYYAGESQVTLNERNTPASHTHNPSLDVSYTDNGESRHLYNRLSASGIFLSNDFNTLSDNLDLRQRKKLRAFDVSNDFSWRIKTGRHIWGLGLNLRYNRSPETDLRVSSASDSGRSALQTMSGTTFQSESTANTSWNFGGWRIHLPLSAMFRRDVVESLIAGTEFENDVRGNRLQAAASPGFEYTAPGRLFEISGGVSAGMLVFHARNRGVRPGFSYERPFFNPNFRFKYNFTPNFGAQFNAGFDHSIGDVLDLLTEPIMTSWHTRKSASGILARNDVFNSRIGIDFKKPMEFWFANAGVSYSRSKRNVLNSQYVSSSEVTSGGLAADNSSQNASVNLSVTKQIVDLGIKATLSAAGSWSRSEMMQQERVIPYFGRSFSVTPRLTLAPWKWMELNWSGSFSKTFSRYLNIRDSYDMLGNDLRLSLYPFSGWDFFGEAELMRKQLTDGTRKSISLFDLGVSYKTKRFKLTLRADNILDTRNYYYSIYSGLDTYTYNYTLRPRTISLGITLMK